MITTILDDMKFHNASPIFGIFSFSVFDNKQKNRIGGILNLLLIMMFIASGLIGLVATLGTITEEYLNFTLKLVLVVMPIFAICFILLRKGFLKLTSVTTSVSLLSIIVIAMLMGDGTRDVVILLIPPFMLVTSLLLKRRWYFSINAVALSIVVGIGLGEIYGIITSRFSQQTTIEDLIMGLIFLLGTVIFVRVLTEILFSTLDKVEKSEVNLKNAQKIARIGSWEWNIISGNLNWSTEVFRIFGVDPETFEVTFAAFSERIHSEDKENVTQAINETINDSKPYDIEFRLVKPNNEICYVRAQGEIKNNISGKPGLIVGTIQDITNRKQAEEKREKLIKELQKALDNVKILEGMLPICASCKKIKDDEGYWKQIESYIEQRTDALFSHSICPECAEKLYGDTKWFKKSREKKD